VAIIHEPNKTPLRMLKLLLAFAPAQTPAAPLSF
jgi:hypothetical protein